MRIWFLLAAASAAGLSGCASFVDGSHQYITVNSGPVNYAHCVLSRPGETLNVTTPGSVRLLRSYDDLSVRCSRPGYTDTTATIPSDINLWTFGNLATGGITALVDVWTGAMYEYPTEFNIPMTPGMTQPSAAAAYTSTYTMPPPPASAPAMPEPAPMAAAPPSDGKPLPGTLPENY